MKPQWIPSSAIRFLAWSCLASAVRAQIPPASPQLTTAPYEYIDRVEGDYVSYDTVPRRPMVLLPDGSVYAVNTSASTVVYFAGPIASSSTPIAPTATFHTPSAPVSIALWTDPDATTDPDRLVVVCDVTYALAILRRSDGAIVDFVELRRPGQAATLGEPSDLLVDATAHRAFVSCAAADAVAEIDLRTAQVVQVYDLPAKHPVFMCFDANRDVLVAPLLSGNNSAAKPDDAHPVSAAALGPTVLDLADTSVATSGLPDHDLFRLQRGCSRVQPVMTASGTVLFACGINPQTGALWQLNTEANNKDAAAQGGPAIAGNIVFDRVSIGTPAQAPTSCTAALPAPTQPSLLPPLDQLVSGVSVGQPYALDFIASSGQGLVTGLLTDNVVVLSSTGGYVANIALPDGSIPRGVLHDANHNKILAYCWGASTIELYADGSGYAHHAQLDLGYDPTPLKVQRGRRIFYDGARSALGNASCASCHIEGRTDMLVWNLGNLDLDDKGPMVTQTLAGIERLVPFHWRGEQQKNLADFNPAFVDLLGASSQLTPTEFDQFQAFVFSIQDRPNPFQNEERLVDATLQPALPSGTPTADAIQGQSEFITSCEHCHGFPMGTNNDVVNAGNSSHQERLPRRLFTKIIPFNDLYAKQQDADRSTLNVNDPVSIHLVSNPSGTLTNFPLLGPGLTHAGLLDDIWDFNARVFSGLGTQVDSDLTAFLFQWDQGIAPAAYRGTLLNKTNTTATASWIGNYLVPQADARNCDLVAFGTSTFSGVVRAVRWYYDRDLAGSARFVPDDSTLPHKDLSFFSGQAALGRGSNVFLGLPVGTGRRFAIDFDGDDLLNQDEALHSSTTVTVSPTNPDSDGDGDPDGHETANGGDPANAAVPSNDTTAPQIVHSSTPMATGKCARIDVETDVPCTITVDYALSAGGPAHAKGTTELARTHSIVLNDLELSATGTLESYSGTITAHDAAGLTTTANIASMPAYNFSVTPGAPAGSPITTRLFADIPVNGAVIDSLSATHSLSGTTLTAHVSLNVLKKIGGSSPGLSGRLVVARVFVGGTVQAGTLAPVAGSNTQVWSASNPLLYIGLPYTPLAGDYVMSDTSGSSGATTFDFTVSGVPSASTPVLLNVEFVTEPLPPNGLPDIQTILDWNMPTTTASNRKLAIQ